MIVEDLLTWMREIWQANEPPRWAVITAPLLIAVYKFLTWHFDVFKKIGVKGPRPWPLLGSMMPLLKLGIFEHDLEMKRLYGPIVGTFNGRQPSMLIYDLDIAKTIMVKDFDNFRNRKAIEFTERPFDKMLSMLKDDHWKHVRNTLTPTFSSGKLRKMQEKIEKCAETLVNNLQKKADAGETFDLRDYSGAFTMDAIASTAFGLQIDSNQDVDNQFVRLTKKIFEFSLSPKTLLLAFMPFLSKPLGKLGVTTFPTDVVEFLVECVDTALAQRKLDSTDETAAADFLQLMVKAETSNEEAANDEDSEVADKVTSREWKSSRRGLTHEEVVSQSVLFFLTGYETTASALSFLGYLLAVNSDCQEKLIKEIDNLLNDQKHVTYDVINQMKYLDMCVCEALRLYPTGVRADRESVEETTINGVTIPKGILVNIPIYAIHNDPQHWPQPTKFDPDRFLPEAKAARNPYCYMPFGMGPRNCIGMRLALMEMKIAIVQILRKFRLVVCDETQIPLKLEKFRVRGSEGIKLRLQSRMSTS